VRGKSSQDDCRDLASFLGELKAVQYDVVVTEGDAIGIVINAVR
jgi:hypothetical protein